MLEDMRTQFLMLPAEARELIVPRLRESGIGVAPSTKKMPRRFRDAGEVLTCTQGGGATELLIVREDYLPEQFRDLTAVLMFPRAGCGFLSGLSDRPVNARLREAIHAILYEPRENPSAL